MKRLIFMGPHCSGKTTRATLVYRVLKAAGFEVALRPEGARQCPYPLNEQGGYMTQRWILNYYRANDVLRDYNAQIVVMDRCSLDTIPYTTYLYSVGRLSDRQFEELIFDAWSIYKSMKGTKIVFYCEPLPLVADGVRSTNPEFRAFIIRQFENILGLIPDTVIRLGGEKSEEKRDVATQD
ncbi:MAG: hypothetical protein DRJ38_00260 [Thermoprotei archaeon]|nr:MAG: hypothetical protein DRJ38_00260 [Thermoprotei archaeon]